MLRVNRRRFKCKKCRKSFNESLAFVKKKKNFTKKYAQRIAEQVVHSDINNVAKNNKLTEEEVWSMVKNVANQIDISQKEMVDRWLLNYNGILLLKT